MIRGKMTDRISEELEMIRHISLGRRAGALGVGLIMISATSGVALAATPKASKDNDAAALVPAKYKDGLTVATDATYPPDEFMKGSKMVGFDIDLIKAIGTTLGVKISTKSAVFDNIIPGLKSGQYDVGNSSFTDTAERQKAVNFVDYFKAGEQFYTRKGNDSAPKTLAQLCGHSVAVESGTVEESDAKAQKAKCKNGKTVKVNTYQTQTDADLSVKSGHSDVGFADSQVAGYIVVQSKGAFQLSGKPFGVAPYGIATQRSADGRKLARAIQAALRVLVDNGVYKGILEKYGVADGALKKSAMVLNGGK